MTLNCPDVRLATVMDRDQVLDMCLKLAAENAPFPINPEKVQKVVDAAVTGDPKYIIAVSGDGEDGKIKGCICLQFGTHWYADLHFISDLFNYVLPEHRKTNIARQQLRFAKMVGDEFNMPVFVGIVTAKRAKAKIHLYEAEFTNVGGNFVYFPAPIAPLFEPWMAE